MATFSTLHPTPLQFLWNPWLPLGKITLLIGDPGSAKSLLALHLAAQLSQALPLGPSLLDPSTPQPLDPSATLLLSQTDDPEDTALPRLAALSANLNLIHHLPELYTLIPEPRSDCPLTILSNYLSDHPAIRLLIIDPLVDFLGPTDHRLPPGALPLHRSRTILPALARLAKQHNLAILAIARLTKNLSLQNIYRAAGSHAFAAATRAVHLLTTDPDSPTRRLLIPLKTNLTTLPPSLAFSLTTPATHQPAPSPGIAIPAAYASPNPNPFAPRHSPLDTCSSVLSTQSSALPLITWEPLPPSDLPAIPTQSPFKPRNPDHQLACDFLTTLLADGPIPAATALQAAKQHLIAPRTLARAKRTLQIQTYRPPTHDAWFWKSPTDPRTPLTLMQTLEKKMLKTMANLSTSGILPPPGPPLMKFS